MADNGGSSTGVVAVLVIFVIVIAPSRRKDQISGLHPTALAVGAGVGTLAFDNNA